MRLAFFLDNRALAGLGALGDPQHGNPGIGGTEYAFLAVVRLLQDSPLEPLLLLTAPQPISGLDPARVRLVPNLAAALAAAQRLDATALVFRPGVSAASDDWPALEHSRLPLVAWLHNLGCEQQARYESLPALRRWVLVSGAQLDHFRHSRLAAQAVVIPNPVAVPAVAAGRRDRATALAATDLAYIGALTPFKGFDRLAGCWGTIASACPQARLLVIGGADLYGERAAAGSLTPYEQQCRLRLERGAHGERVRFLGSQGLERYAALRTVAVGVVNPSGADETFCLSAAELSACGLPVVAARRHALVQTVRHGITGLLAGSDTELAQHCIRLLGDPERAWRLGLAGQKHVQEAFGAEQVRSGWWQLAAAIAAGEPCLPPHPAHRRCMSSAGCGSCGGCC